MGSRKSKAGSQAEGFIRRVAMMAEESGMGWLRKKVRGSVSVVGQDKGSVVPHRTPRLFLYRLSQFFHHAHTIFEYHTVWSPSRRKTHTNFAQLHSSDWR